MCKEISFKILIAIINYQLILIYFYNCIFNCYFVKDCEILLSNTMFTKINSTISINIFRVLCFLDYMPNKYRFSDFHLNLYARRITKLDASKISLFEILRHVYQVSMHDADMWESFQRFAIDILN